MSSLHSLWFSLYDFSFDYKGNEPAFIEKEFPWSKEFQASFKEIKSELYRYLKEHRPEAYFNQSMVNQKNSWKTISLKWWGIEFYKRQKYFPLTSAILHRYPEVLSLSFNSLEQGGSILPHCGDTNGIYRCHFGIEIPGGLPEVGFKVKEELRNWKEGEWLFFMDAYVHEAFNHSQKERIIMVVDYLRPEFKSRKRKIISIVLTSLFLQKRVEKWKILKKTPAIVVKGISFLLRPFAWISVKTCNFLKVY